MQSPRLGTPPTLFGPFEMVHNVLDGEFGGRRDDGSDIGPAVARAVAKAELVGGDVYLPAGIYNWDTLVKSYNSPVTEQIIGRVRIRGAGKGVTIIRPSIAPFFQVGQEAGVWGVDGFEARDFTVEIQRDFYWAAAFFKLILTRYYRLVNIDLISGIHPSNDFWRWSGYLFDLDTSYLGNIKDCNARGHFVYLYEVTGITRPTEQQDTYHFDHCSVEGICYGIVREPALTTDIHNFHYTNPKYLMSAPWTDASVSVESTVAVASNVGDNVFTLASAAGLAVDDCYWLGQGGNIEAFKIQGVAGNVVTTYNVAKYAHAIGDNSLKGGFGQSFGKKTFNVTLYQPHYEFCAAGVMLAESNNIEVVQPYGTPRDVVRIVRGPVLGVTVRKPFVSGNGGVRNVVRITAAGDHAATRNPIIEGFAFDPNTGAAIPIANLVLNDAGGNRSKVFHDVDIGTGNSVDQRYYPFAGSDHWLEMFAIGVTKWWGDMNGNTRQAGDVEANGGYHQTVDGWYQENVIASQVNVQLSRLATTTNNPSGWVAPRSGSLKGISVLSNAARTAGTLTVTVFKNGVSLGSSATLDGTNTTFKATAFAKDTVTFVAGDVLDIRITTDAAWTPVTADIRAAMEVET